MIFLSSSTPSQALSLSSEIRNYAALLLLIIGGIVGLVQLIKNSKHIRVQNTFRMFALFDELLGNDVIEEWRGIFRGNWESNGLPDGYFYDRDGNKAHFSELFTEGPYMENAVEKLAQYFNLAGETYNSLDLSIFYYKFGQIFFSVYHWLTFVDITELGVRKTFLEFYYPYFHKLYKKYKRKSFALSFHIYIHTP